MSTSPVRKFFALAVATIFLSSCTTGCEPTKGGCEEDEELIEGECVPISEELPYDTSGIFQSLLGFNPTIGMKGGDYVAAFESEGWSAVYENSEYYEEYMSNLEAEIGANIDLAKELDFNVDREIAGVFTWNVIEPEKGTFDWSMSDQVVGAVGEANMTLAGVIQPFASWDQDSVPEGCTSRDFAYYDYKADSPTDWDEYKVFLTALVERYDGDGDENDMEDLTVPVHIWEIGNEYDGSCGGNLNEAENLYELQKVSYETIKAADSKAIVLNAGALETSSTVVDPNFWEDFFELGGGNYMDAFNMHFNTAKGGASDSTTSQFKKNVMHFEDLMAKVGLDLPIWITEFGTYSGDPAGSPPDEQSRDFQAAWHMEASVFSLAHRVEKIFIDFIGKDGDAIGGSALYDEDTGTLREFATTLRTIEEKLGDFDSVEYIGDTEPGEEELGQYLFTTDGKEVYVLWEGSTPTDLTGTVIVTDMYGNESTMDASEIEFSEDTPIFVEKD